MVSPAPFTHARPVSCRLLFTASQMLHAHRAQLLRCCAAGSCRLLLKVRLALTSAAPSSFSTLLHACPCVLLIFVPDRPRACQEVSVVHGSSVQNGRHRSGLDAPPRPMTYSQLEYRYIIANLCSLHLQQCHYTAKRVLHAGAP